MAVTYIALLRAVNLAGKNMVAMSDLRNMSVALGLEEPRTLLQSGNLVFRSADTSAERLEGALERGAASRLGVATEFFVRSAAEWRRVIDANPFPDEAKRDPARLILVCLKKPATAAAVDALQRAIKGREVVRAKQRHAYIVYPDGMGRSKLTGAMIEKHLGCRGTARNWNTVLKLAALSR